MKWVGLTGGLGSGKSTVASILRTKGWPVIDADQIARQVLDPGTEGLTKVLQVFGPDLLLPNGELNRAELGRRVFGFPEKLLKLESIIHPRVQAEVQKQKQQLSQLGFKMAFYDVPLLFEKKLSGFDAVVVVNAPPDVVRERLRKRNGWSEEEIDARLGAQIPLTKKTASADHVIQNTGSLHDLEAEVDRVLADL